MGAILMLLWALAVIAGLVALVFFVLVLVEMFKRQQNGLAIACIVLTVCTGGLGMLVAFIYGWMKATEWNIKKIMLAWTACIVVQLVFGLGILAVGATVAVDANSQFQKQMRQMERDLEKIKIE
jgi:NhaP-type Na+/H+ and K+/H+ antiporter